MKWCVINVNFSLGPHKSPVDFLTCNMICNKKFCRLPSYSPSLEVLKPFLMNLDGSKNICCPDCSLWQQKPCSIRIILLVTNTYTHEEVCKKNWLWYQLLCTVEKANSEKGCTMPLTTEMFRASRHTSLNLENIFYCALSTIKIFIVIFVRYSCTFKV